MHITYDRGSVLLWRRSDTLCTSGCMDNVIFVHKPRLLDVAAQLKRSAHAALGLVANGRTGLLFGALKVTFQMTTTESELFRRCSSQPISWLGTEKTKSNKTDKTAGT